MSKPKPLGSIEFIALIGVLFASVAFSIDAMLPALPQIAAELTPQSPNSAQLIITTFVIGMGAGTLIAGPLSDSFGRKPIILAGAVLYVAGAMMAWWSNSLEWILIGRALQGFGAAGPRVTAIAVVRDLYEGREMAKIVSFAMLIFTIFPAVAPLMGFVIIEAFGWRSIFLAFVVFSVFSVGWLFIRQPETLPQSKRRPLQATELWGAIIEVLSNKIVVLSITAQSLIYGVLFGTIASIQPTFDIAFDLADSFPYWFGTIAMISAIPTVLNAFLVVRVGMRRLIKLAVTAQVGISCIAALSFTALDLSTNAMFWIYFTWCVSLFSMLGFTIGNLNALALQPMGHLAGMTTSAMGAISTLAGGAIGAPIGLLFNGTPMLVSWGILGVVVLAWVSLQFFPKDS